MQRFSLDRRRFAGHPYGVPPASPAPPPPPKAPQRGVIGPPRGGGVPPPCPAFRPPLRPPWGTPTGFPRLRRLPLLSLFGNGRGQAKRAGAAAPERGWKKIKVVAPIAAARPPAVEMWGRWGSRWAGVGAAGGQPPGLSTGCPCLCPRTGEAAHRSRSDLHISTARGSNSAPSGGLFCPAGLTTSVQEV